MWPMSKKKGEKNNMKTKINTSYFENSGLILLILIEMRRQGILKGEILIDYLKKALGQLSTEQREKIGKEMGIDVMGW